MWDDISLKFWFAFPWWLVMSRVFSCTYYFKNISRAQGIQELKFELTLLYKLIQHCGIFMNRVQVPPHLSQHVPWSFFKNFSHSNRYVVVYHCVNLHFLGDIWCETSFDMFIYHLCIFFDEVSIKIFDLFFESGCLTFEMFFSHLV